MSTPAPQDEKLKAEMSGSSAESQTSTSKVDAQPTAEHLALVHSARRKLDLTMVPVMTLFYLLSYLDRTNIGNARVAGMQAALKLTDHQFQVAVTVLYVPYICTELPANLLLKKIGPNILMPTILTLWGIVVLFQGFVYNYGGLIAARFFLGLLEGPMFPGIVLYLSGFYTRAELSLRIAYFFSAASLAGAFSGLLAAGIQQMDGKGGKAGWQWIFIIEGLFTVVVGAVAYFLVPATPRHSKLLTPEEAEALIEHLERDRPMIGVHEKFDPREILRALKSPPTIFISLIFFFGGVIFFGLAIFLPSIIRQMQFTPTQSQLLSVGPFATSFLLSLFTAWISDKYNRRGIPLIFLSAMCTAGWALFYASKSVWVSYGAFFLIVPGVFSASPLAAAWLSNNSEPYYRRASSIAFGFMATNFGGILSTWRFPTSEGPRFQKTTIMNMTFASIMTVSAGLNILLLVWMQARKEKNREAILRPYVSDEQPDGGDKAWIELGDKHPDFKYTL